jgi:hypothetical protein
VSEEAKRIGRKKPEDMTLAELRERWPLTLSEKNRRGILTEKERERYERLGGSGERRSEEDRG